MFTTSFYLNLYKKMSTLDLTRSMISSPTPKISITSHLFFYLWFPTDYFNTTQDARCVPHEAKCFKRKRPLWSVKDLTHFHASNPLPMFKFIYKTYQAFALMHRYQSTVLQVKAGSETHVIVSVARITVVTISCWIVVSTADVKATTKSTNGTCWIFFLCPFPYVTS